MQVVEDEKHFPLECPLHADHGYMLLQKWHTNINNFRNMGQEYKYIEIIENKDNKIIALLDKYLQKSMTKRYVMGPI